ncbi:MAG: N-acetylglucosamine-6-phosphate deacetylase [Burkholderiales bacterium]|nr:N-acetylglucosamine-6-phosphate deacetylase [Burkholderiales bacterium]
MHEVLINGRVLCDEGWVTDRVVLIDADRILAIVSPDDPRCASASVRDLGGGMLIPGFIDIQVNGGGGVMFNDDPGVATIRLMAAAHRRFGTTSMLPTLISDELSMVRRALAAIGQAIAEGVPGVIGGHIEGPFLNEERKGTHDADKFRVLNSDAVALLSSLKSGKTLVTLAPEMTTSALIASLASKGVVISAGHTNATFTEMQTALRHGVTGFTHLFNAMSPMTSREPGVVGAALLDPNSWCGIIVDGHHVSPAMLQIALRIKRHDRFMLVTDAMANVGTSQTSFLLQGKKIAVRDGKCVDEHGTLSGSALDMAGAVRNAVAMIGLELAEAVRMASTYPAQFLGLGHELGRITPGYRANLALADDQLNILDTWIDGKSSSSNNGSSL